MNGRQKGRRRAAACVAAVVALCSLSDTVAGSGPQVINSPVVFTQLPRDAEMEERIGPGGGTLRSDYGSGGRIVRLDPDGQLHVLTAGSQAGNAVAPRGFHSACGADVSFDGQRILFAAKRKAGDPWNIWEMNADGSGARQITRDLGNCKSPAYQATLYTIVSTEPWYQVMFVSDAAGAMNEYGSGPALSLYSCKLDGSGARRLTLNLSDDLDPFLMADGRVLLASWQRVDASRGFGGRVSLFGVNADGADYALYTGLPGRRVKHMPCEVLPPDGPRLGAGLVVFVEADQVGWDGAGQLACVTTRRPFHSYRRITESEGLLWHSPSPLPDGSILVSRRTADVQSTHGLFRLDPHTGEASPVFDDPNWHDVHARLLVPRPRPDGRSSVVNEKYPTGKLYCLNAYQTGTTVQPRRDGNLIRRLRVIEGVPVSRSAASVYLPSPGNLGLAGPGSTVNGIPPIVQKRVLGEIAVEPDGSFQIELPADLPVQLQTLDENGLALRTCGWIWAKHREPRGCIGCHEDPELTPANRFVQAVQKPGIELTMPAEQRRTVDFRRDVMPILEAKCTGCHGSDDPPPNLGSGKVGPFNRAYVSLLEADSAESPGAGRYVHPGRARTSPLIWLLFGQNTSRPWDATYGPEEIIPQHPPRDAEPLTKLERQVIVDWIDLGAQWDGIPGEDDFSSALNERSGAED